MTNDNDNDKGTTTAPKPAINPKDAAKVAINQSASKRLMADQEKGYSGTVTDPTPNENYTVAGVTSGAKTPENDLETRAEVRRGKVQ